jgi:AcrR family transcriptional regulator
VSDQFHETDHPRMRSDARRNRGKILAAARAVVAETGADASLEEIARRAGVGSATLHRHFDSRATLLQAIFHESITALCDRAEALAQDADGATALVTWLRELVSHAAATRGLAATLMELPSAGRCAHPHHLIRQAGQLLLSCAQRSGSVSADITVDDVLHLANGVALAAEASANAINSADTLMDIVANGLVRQEEGLKPLRQRPARSS